MRDERRDDSRGLPPVRGLSDHSANISEPKDVAAARRAGETASNGEAYPNREHMVCIPGGEVA
jgi:hypothetical protein